MVGVAAGLVPCPLTLFAMLLSLKRGVPEVGLTFAAAMMIGVGLTLAAVAVSTALAREWILITLVTLVRHGASMYRVSRTLDGIAGASLLLIGVRELLI